MAAVRHVQLHGLEGGNEDAEPEADQDGGRVIHPFQREEGQSGETGRQDAQGNDGKLRHAAAVDLPAHHEPRDQHADPHQGIKQARVLEAVHFAVQGGVNGHHSVGKGSDHDVDRQGNAHAQHEPVQHLFGRFLHGLLNGAFGGADEGGNARSGQAQDQGAPGDYVKAVLLVHLEADHRPQAHAQRHRHPEKAQAFAAAGGRNDVHGHRRAGRGHAAPDQPLDKARCKKHQGRGGNGVSGKGQGQQDVNRDVNLFAVSGIHPVCEPGTGQDGRQHVNGHDPAQPAGGDLKLARQVQRKNGNQLEKGQPHHQVGAAGQHIVPGPERDFDRWNGCRRQFISRPVHAGVVQPSPKVSNDGRVMRKGEMEKERNHGSLSEEASG